MRRLVALAFVAGALSATSAGPAVAATSPSIVPETASPGMTVIFQNGCRDVTETPPAALRVAFTQDDEVPQEGAAEKVTGHQTEPFTYSFVIPDIDPGAYLVWLECLPDDWSTSRTEPGGPAGLVVIGAPATDADAVTRRPTPKPSAPLPVIVAAFAIGLAALRRRLRADAASTASVRSR